MFAELLCRSNFSFLRGASHPEELISQAALLGLPALAIADRDGVYGLAKAYWRAQKTPGLKLIFGAELSLRLPQGERLGLVLHARSKPGWSLLCRLLTASHAGKPKGEAWLELDAFAAQVRAAPGGLLCLPRPCEGAGPHDPGSVLAVLKSLFQDDLFLPLTRVLDGQDAGRTAEARLCSRRFDIPVVASNDVHYHVSSRQALQDSLVCVREGLSLPDAGFKLFSNAERRLKSPAEMAALFADWPEALSNTLKAAARCDFSLSQLRYRYPSEWIPGGMGSDAYLKKLAWAGAEGHYGATIPDKVRSLLAHELGLIARLGYADYFLTLHEIVGFARSKGILCQGRGSAANSVVCYCLGITAVDPSRSEMLFERFLSEERAEPPDIDVDFEHERREEVIQHIYEKYGRDRAAMAAAVITYRPRSAIAEMSKALARPTRVKRTLRDLDWNGFDPKVQELARELEGFPRHLSIHSGGFVLSDGPLLDLVPIEPARMDGRTVIQWDKYDLDHIGLMKVDVLALGMLSALKRCMDAVGFADLARIPAEDKATYRMIQQGDTVGVFQIESRAQMNMLGRLKPESFYDLVIEVAIVRPGPIVGKMVHPYLKRRQGLEQASFEHPKLEAILGRTLGVPLFQEQVMRIAVELGGFSPGESDELRRAIGAWRSDGRLNAIGERLLRGLRASGLSEAFCDGLFKEIQGFAEYGFPESHAASFALLCYASSYLKCHHPAEFACALINSQPMGFYAPHSLVDDAKRHGVAVRPVHPNESGWDCEAGPGWMQLGFCVVVGLGKGAAEALLAARQARPFEDLDDFVRRCQLRPALVRSLAMGGAFACFGLSPRDALWRVLLMGSFASQGGPQLDLFGSLSPGPSAQDFDAMHPYLAVAEAYKAFGLSTQAHPMQALRLLIKDLPPLRASGARALPNGARCSLAGLVIVRQRPGTAAGVVFATLEDETGLLDLVLHVEVYERFREVLLNHQFLCASGVLQRDRDSASMLLKHLKAIDPDTALNTRAHNWH